MCIGTKARALGQGKEDGSERNGQNPVRKQGEIVYIIARNVCVSMPLLVVANI
jgi:hypothetical protein